MTVRYDSLRVDRVETQAVNALAAAHARYLEKLEAIEQGAEA